MGLLKTGAYYTISANGIFLRMSDFSFTEGAPFAESPVNSGTDDCIFKAECAEGGLYYLTVQTSDFVYQSNGIQGIKANLDSQKWKITSCGGDVFHAQSADGTILRIGGSENLCFSELVPSTNGKIKIMTLGDSITNGAFVCGGYRTEFLKRAQMDGKSIRFVGSKADGYGQYHEGHCGWTIEMIEKNIEHYLRVQPDRIFLMIGTNNIPNGSALMLQKLKSLTDTILSLLSPTQILFLSTVTPCQTDEHSVLNGYNAGIVDLVSKYRENGRAVYAADMNSAITTEDLLDGVHPTERGYRKMAEAWYRIAEPFL